jgi:hypothetical protein
VKLGWIERVALPELGLHTVQAKIDTGARTSALHVSSTRRLPRGKGQLADGDGDGQGTERLLIVVPGARGRLEVEVHEWIVVLDTSGRRERRPVIRTVLELGGRRRIIRIGLTDRGQMSCPLLIGRTALPPRAVVDPHARHLLAAEPRQQRSVGARLGKI